MKKLDLSPLPEQTEDYSHYQETVVRWDRIIASVVGLICVVGLAIYLLFFKTSDLEDSTSSELKSSLDKPLANTKELPNQKTGENVNASLKLESLPQGQDTSSSIVGAKQTVSKEAGSGETKIIENAEAEHVQRSEKSVVAGLNLVSSVDANAFLKPSPKLDQSISEENKKGGSSEAAKAGPRDGDKQSAEVDKRKGQVLLTEVSVDNSIASSEVKKTEVELAPTIIVNSGIEQAVLSLSNEKPLPGEPMEKVVSMNDQGLIKVVLHTVMKGMKGKTLYHEWYRNEVRQARVRIPVNVTVQKSYSSKFIDRQMLGLWKVKVIDKEGEPYVLADFEVIR